MMKQAIIAQLADPDKNVRNQVSGVVAGISSLDIPRGEWSDLIPMLCNNAEHEDINIRLASLTCLGKICEDLHSESVPQNNRYQIIVALINNLNLENLEICRVAMRALSISVSFSA